MVKNVAFRGYARMTAGATAISFLTLSIVGTWMRLRGGPFTVEGIGAMALLSQAAAYAAITLWSAAAMAAAIMVIIFSVVALAYAGKALHLLAKKVGNLPLPWGL